MTALTVVIMHCKSWQWFRALAVAQSCGRLQQCSSASWPQLLSEEPLSHQIERWQSSSMAIMAAGRCMCIMSEAAAMQTWC